MSAEKIHVHYSVGRAYAGKEIKVCVHTSGDTLYMSTDLAREFAVDILLQVDRIEKTQIWNSLSNKENT